MKFPTVEKSTHLFFLNRGMIDVVAILCLLLSSLFHCFPHPLAPAILKQRKQYSPYSDFQGCIKRKLAYVFCSSYFSTR